MRTPQNNQLRLKPYIRLLAPSITEIREIALGVVNRMFNQIRQFDDHATIGEIRVDVDGNMSWESYYQISEEIKRQAANRASHTHNQKCRKALFVVCFNDKYFYDFRLTEYDSVIVAQSDTDRLIDSLPIFESVIEKRLNDREKATQRAKIEWSVTQELDNAIAFDHRSEEVYFDKQEYDCTTIDAVLYNKLRPKGYKYKIRESDKDYIVCVQLTHNEVINYEI